jgi:hypothetical protein
MFEFIGLIIVLGIAALLGSGMDSKTSDYLSGEDGDDHQE